MLRLFALLFLQLAAAWDALDHEVFDTVTALRTAFPGKSFYDLLGVDRHAATRCVCMLRNCIASAS